MNRYKNIYISLLLQILFFHFQNSAQTNILTKTGNAKQALKTYQPGVIVSSIVKGDSTIQTFSLDLNEDVKIIAQFKEPPLSHVKADKQTYSLNKMASAQSRIANEHSYFLNALSQIESRIVTQPHSIFKTANTKIRFEYKTVINGMALTTKRWVVEEIKKLSYVKSVYEDKEVKAYDTISNHVIGADSVWTKLGLTGKRIKIGIIDTGIDYLLPDLGGGIGPGFKVLGGFDFINNDNDPMDDNGHGTHVAGIAAANGITLKGVAPDANLYAFKVLDNAGSGPSSVVIAGIERALDPDQDPNTNDAVNIISMSLGGPGDPDDPISQAVDNATAAGVLCTIAAGNNGAYQTIGSPGCARTALTVGATDNNDGIAYFSSRGPSNNIYGIKPDILAPGVEINSTKMGGGYIAYSGTSMATPHVAGAAALILQLHPDWTPAMIKSALMETAKDLGNDIWTQGNGRVDVYKATGQNTFISPASLSFGVVDLSQSVFSVVDTIWIYNLSLIQKSYSFSLSSYLPAGFNITFDQSSVILNPNEIKSVIVSAIVNNNILPFANIDPPAYTGKIIAISSLDTLKIPYALIKSPILKISFDEEPWLAFIHNRKDKNYFIPDPGNNLSLLLPQDTYDVLITYHDAQTFIFKEGIAVNSLNIIQINKSDAKNKIHLLTLDENGNNIYSNNGAETFIHKTSKIGQVLMGVINMEEYFSDISDNYLWEWSVRSGEYSKKVYTFNGYLNKGCSSDITQSNDPSSFRHITFNYHFEPGTLSVFPIFWFSKFSEWLSISLGSWRNDALPLTPPFEQEAYITPLPYPDFANFPFFYNSLYQFKGFPFDMSQSTSLVETPLVTVKNRDTVEVWLAGDTAPIDKLIGTVFNAKYGAPHWFGKLQNTPTSINLRDARGNFFTRLFYYPLKDYTPLPDLRYQLYQGANLVDSGKVYDKTNLVIPVSPGQYTLKIPTDHYYIHGKKGNALVQLTFDTRKIDNNPPVIISLKIFAGSEITDIIKPTDNGSINFSIEDASALSNVRLYIQSQDSTIWDTLNTNNSGNIYIATVPQNLSEGFVSLKISAEDSFNNKLEYEVNPAFYFDSGSNTDILPPGPVTNLTADVDTQHQSVILRWTAPGDDDYTGIASKYDLRVSAVPPQNVYADSAWFVSARKVGVTQTPHASGIVDTVLVQNIPLDTTFYFALRTADEKLNWSPVSNVVQVYIPQLVFSYIGIVEKIENNTLFIKAEKQRNILKRDTTLIVNTDTATRFILSYFPSTYPPNGGGDLFFQESILKGDMLGKDVKAVSLNNIKDVINFYAVSIDASIVYNLFVKINSPTSFPTLNTDKQSIGISGKIYSGTGKKISSFIVTNITNGISKPDSSVNNKYSADFNVTGIPLLNGMNIIVATAKDSVGYIGEDTLLVTYSRTDVVDNEIPTVFSIAQNYPNPFNPLTTIGFSIPTKSFVSLKVFDLIGREVTTLMSQEKPAGTYHVTFDASKLPSGVYFYRLTAGDFMQVKKMLMIK
jgi:hypothetical protein